VSNGRDAGSVVNARARRSLPFVLVAVVLVTSGVAAFAAVQAESTVVPVTTGSTFRWATATPFPSLIEGQSGACLASGVCVMAGMGGQQIRVLLSDRIGAAWTSRPLPFVLTPGALEGAACAAPGSCWFVGSSQRRAVVLHSADSGMTWQRQALPPGIDGLSAVSCPTAQECWAVGLSGTAGVVIETHDGGAFWTKEKVPYVSPETATLACPSAGHCFLATLPPPSAPGQTINLLRPLLYATSDGTTWSLLGHLPPQPGLPGNLECPDTTTCWYGYLGGRYGNLRSALAVSFNGGRSWQASGAPLAPTPAHTASPLTPSVACLSASVCLAADGARLLSTNDAHHWSVVRRPANAASINAVSCSDSSICLLRGESAPFPPNTAVDVTLDGGATWVAEQWPFGILSFGPISCGRPQVCLALAAGGGLLLSRTGGRSWRPLALQGFQLVDRFSCSVQMVCTATGKTSTSQQLVLVTTRDVGEHWIVRRFPIWAQGAQPRVQIETSTLTCPSPETCYAVASRGINVGDDAVVVTHDGGRSWRATTLPSSTPNTIASLDCPIASSCWVTGQNLNGMPNGAYLDRTADGGRNWEPLTLPDPSQSYLGVACTGQGACWTMSQVFNDVGANQPPVPLRSDNGATTWSESALSNHELLFPLSVTCAGADRCWGLAFPAAGGGASLVSTTNAGQSWVSDSTVGPVPFIGAITCPEPDACIGPAQSTEANGVTFVDRREEG